ncbi:MAG TPA: MarR family transcriptional regulator [Ktedonobacterales bacterium]|jgi:DNA-binding MarR family transcriptional regulator
MSVNEENSYETPVVIAHGLDHWWASLGREFGPLSLPQRRTLHTLAGREAASQATRVGEIAALLHFTTAGATRMLDTVEALGYVTRYRSPQMDQRQVYLALTPAGRAALEQADGVFTARVAASLEPLSESEREMLATLLARLTRLPSGSAPEARAPGSGASEGASTEA